MIIIIIINNNNKIFIFVSPEIVSPEKATYRYYFGCRRLVVQLTANNCKTKNLLTFFMSTKYFFVRRHIRLAEF